MPTCDTYCITPMPEHTVNDCGETVAAGGKNSVTFDCQSAAYQNTDYTKLTIEQDVADGYATIIKDTMIDAPDATPNAASAAAVAGEEPVIKSYTQTLTISDPNISELNDAAYEELDATNGRKIAAVITTTVDGHSELYEAISSFQMTITKPSTGSVDDFIKYTSTITGKMKNKSKMIATPDIY